MPEKWDIVNEVCEEDVPPVEQRRPEIVPPSGVRIGGVVEVTAAAGGDVGILAFEGVSDLQVQVAPHGSVQMN